MLDIDIMTNGNLFRFYSCFGLLNNTRIALFVIYVYIVSLEFEYLFILPRFKWPMNASSLVWFLLADDWFRIRCLLSLSSFEQINTRRKKNLWALCRFIDGDFVLFHQMEKIFSHAWADKHGENKNGQAESNAVTADGECLQRKNTVDTTLLVHFFGKKGTNMLKYEDFRRFMENLQTEVLEMEFQEFAKGATTISEIDFARILLRYTHLDPKV